MKDPQVIEISKKVGYSIIIICLVILAGVILFLWCVDEIRDVTQKCDKIDQLEKVIRDKKFTVIIYPNYERMSKLEKENKKIKTKIWGEK